MNLLSADDQKMESQFTNLGFDGTWSLRTKLIILALKSQGMPLDLNLNWVITDQLFTCPICERSKADIMIKTKNRVLAILHIDHDHFLDWFKLQFKKMDFPNGSKDLVLKNIRYQPLIICSNCNKIDSQLKIIFPEIDPFFSFSPCEKKFCLLKVGRKSHKISPARGLKIWQDYKDDFRLKQRSLELDIHDLFEKTKGKWFDYRKLLINQVKMNFVLQTQKIYGRALPFQEFIARSTSNLGVPQN